MEVLEFALQTIRRVDSGGSVGDDVSHPRRMHWVGWERHVDQAHGNAGPRIRHRAWGRRVDRIRRMPRGVSRPDVAVSQKQCHAAQ